MGKINVNEQNLRKKIFEFLLNSEEIKDIIKNPNKKEIQKKLYDNIIDLKNMIEKEELDESKIIEKLKETKKNISIFQNILEKFV